MPDAKNDTPIPQASDKPKVGVYICYCGGNISDHVDVEEVRRRMEDTPGVAVARTNMFMCSDPGQESIMEDLRNGIVNRVVVASCAPSLHETTFRAAIERAGGNPYQYEHANIREQVSWVHHGDAATDKATRLIRAATGKAALLKPLEPIRVEARRHALVIGGGLAGMRAALDMADRGIETVLIEKTPYLGGGVARLGRLAPNGEDAAGIVADLAARTLGHPAVTVHCGASLTAFGGYVGKFAVSLSPQPNGEAADAAQIPGTFVQGKGVAGPTLPQGEPVTLETGVIVLATGFSSYMPRTGEYGFGEHNEVITLPDLIRELATKEHTGGGVLHLGGRPIRRLALIHCVGSRQIPGIHEEDESGHLNEHCSRVCCSAAINAANTIREAYPETAVYDLYRDIRTYGRGQEEMYAKASANKVVFMRFSPEEAPTVDRATDSGFPLALTVKDELTFGEELQVPVDLVVLATGLEPAPITDLVNMLKLPVGADRFLLEVHPKLRPVELPLSGVFLAGACQAPMDAGEAASAASSAAVKAASLLGKGYVELDPFVAEVDLARCKGTGACVSACLNEGALRLVPMDVGGETVNRAQVTPALCLGCGACVAVCPENAININGWTLKQYEAMVDMIVSDIGCDCAEGVAAGAPGQTAVPA
ncbi:fumarate reductase/succinate dehydrogenase flavoprotein domain protein [Solidesulfovibrio fructosivorans JJ]]|uniref:Fumarate reductase/succinate dehydrogenase flavoprotein domain protein n=1 Tax=Solidesulfovibrio fructosivorans JJ] TaxID=596151 RepID=E1JW96_SOLFR|nr:CoB--CoM heterodisulfide reductase iron-sulfur subunit A family protein [Solidesulfovibrio fructosivorans]EFL51456.1 fumarate reductase/succinate dehydrogenase flavoprotein domain protein [Solidesulfovibrio fructosivorans JJ]]